MREQISRETLERVRAIVRSGDREIDRLTGQDIETPVMAILEPLVDPQEPPVDDMKARIDEINARLQQLEARVTLHLWGIPGEAPWVVRRPTVLACAVSPEEKEKE